MVIESLSSKRILTMEFVDGVKVNDIEALNALGIKPQDVASVGLYMLVVIVSPYVYPRIYYIHNILCVCIVFMMYDINDICDIIYADYL